jgi:DNA/RNA endonuclease G (NUC1)
VAEEPRLADAIARDPNATDEEKGHARAALDRLKKNEELSEPQADALEAIILPKERPVVFVRDDKFEAPGWPFEHLDQPQFRARIEAAIPMVGRIELPGSPLPYGGTGFIVGDGVLMTNRHVANLFAEGLGRRDLSFQSGQAAGVDFKREHERETTRPFRIDKILMIHPYWDMALLAVEGLGGGRSLQLSIANPEELVGREVAVVGYPALDPRNDIPLQNRLFKSVFNVKRMQPGKLRPREETQSFGRVVSAIAHDSSTLGGNSGSAVVDVQSGEVVALHFAGVYLKANYGVPSYELARDPRVVDAGVRFTGSIATRGTPWDDAWDEADPPDEAPPDGGPRPPALSAGSAVSWTIPVEVTIRVGGASAGDRVAVGVGPRGDGTADLAGVERMVEPFRDESYDGRQGYDERFLGIRLRLPTVANKAVASKLEDGTIVLPYEHFSIVMHRQRRLALFAASNVDARPASKRPDPGKDYARRALTGLGKNDQEKWFTDPRIPGLHQLPDRFFTRDQGAFDKGHIVRREDVAWGRTYEELRRANGDTYHVTNCSPQVAGFNRSNLGGTWGELENVVLEQAKADQKYSLFAGLVLDPNDKTFLGRDLDGATRVQIPSRFWKVVVARSGDRLTSFAFLLEQDLSDVNLEFAVPVKFRSMMISVPDLEKLLPDLRFPPELHSSDEFESEVGEAVRTKAQIERR